MTDLVSPKCPNCGAQVEVAPGSTTVECKYCGNSSVVQAKPASPAGPPPGDFSAFGQGPPPPQPPTPYGAPAPYGAPSPYGTPPQYGGPAPGYVPPMRPVTDNTGRNVAIGVIVAFVGIPILLVVVGMVVAIGASSSSPPTPYVPPPAYTPAELPLDVVRDTASGQEEACDKGSGINCFEAGLRYENGNGVTKDNRKAVNLYKQACDLEYDGGCTNYGLAHQRGTGVAKDLKKYVKYSKKACKLGSKVGCNNLGSAYAEGEGVKKDVKKAIEYFEEACDEGAEGGSHYACFNLGATSAQNPKLRNDPKKVAKYYQIACDKKHTGACVNLADMYMKGRGVKKNTVKAKSLYNKACSLGRNDACGK